MILSDLPVCERLSVSDLRQRHNGALVFQAERVEYKLKDKNKLSPFWEGMV